MEKLIPFTVNDLAKVTNFRCGEVKFGEKMITVPKDSDAISFLNTCEAKYVLFGIPEDIGVRANYGRPGAASAWQPGPGQWQPAASDLPRGHGAASPGDPPGQQREANPWLGTCALESSSQSTNRIPFGHFLQR